MNRVSKNDRKKRNNKGLTQEEYVNRYKKENKNEVKNKKSKPKKKKKNFLVRIIGKIFFIFFICLIIFSALFFWKVRENGGGIRGVLCTVFGQTVESLEDLEPITVLLLGISEDIDVKLTDTIILCTYNPQEQTASMVSIPRDTFVGKNKDTAKGNDKINSLYSKGVEKTVKSVSKITGVDIKYYMVVNTEALVKIVDILGGVNFEVPIDMKYDDPTQNLHINLKSGMQKIDGKKAEQLLRFRHNNDGSSYPGDYGDNDFGRMKTQRAFIFETIKQTIDIKNIPKAYSIVNTVFKNIETNLEKEDLVAYIPTIAEFNIDNITSEQLPGASEKCNGLWFFIYNEKETKNLVEKLKIKNAIY